MDAAGTAPPSVAACGPACPRRLFAALPCRNDIRAEDVVLSELLNQRGPAAWLAAPCSGPAASDSSCSSEGSEHSQGSKGSGGAPGAALVRLAQRCFERGEVLVLNTQMQHFDLLLLPRQAAAADGVAFAVFATRVRSKQFTACSAQCHTCSPPEQPCWHQVNSKGQRFNAILMLALISRPARCHARLAAAGGWRAVHSPDHCS